MNGEPVAVVDGQTDEVFFIRKDHIGRPVFATNDSGVKVGEASSALRAFGGAVVSSGPSLDLRFPGQWFQSENGLHQNWMRDYDATTGRYIQAHPLGLVDGASVYGYAQQNLTRYVDPRGEQSNDDSGGGLPGFWRHFSQCVQEHDPLSNEEKLAAFTFGGPIPKQFFRLLRGLSGASSYTTIPSAAAHYATGGKTHTSRTATAARNVGRLGVVGMVGYSWYLLGIEGYCACEAF